MPREKELEQLPQSNIAPGMGNDRSKMDREILGSIVQGEQPRPSKAKKEGS